MKVKELMEHLQDLDSEANINVFLPSTDPRRAKYGVGSLKPIEGITSSIDQDTNKVNYAIQTKGGNQYD